MTMNRKNREELFWNTEGQGKVILPYSADVTLPQSTEIYKLLSYGDNSWWWCRTANTPGAMDTSGVFSGMAGHFALGDLVWFVTSGSDGGVFVVRDDDPVDLANLNNLGLANSD